MLERMHFSGTWRDYQARVLEEMPGHFDDGRLHVVAAPGAGKTVLGLEIVRRLERRALVFSPSLAIRDQWRDRLVPLFMASPPAPGEVSTDLSAPAALTLATYQSLDSYRRADELETLIANLDATGPLTLVLDEAHHLRRSWWECLDRLASDLKDVRIVALTATPPYDASFAEWSRYERLCGPIDLEIGIPELVRNGDLCPHQDHLVLSHPDEDALQLLRRRRMAISDLQMDLRADDELLGMLQAHPWLLDPESAIEDVLDAPEMLSAVLVLLGSAGRELPRAPLDLLGVSRAELPLPNEFWLEVLLEGMLHRHSKTFVLAKDRRDALRKTLHRHGLIEGGRVRLRHTRSTFRLLSASLAKLDSIRSIVASESATLGKGMRMVILSDHIRAGELPRTEDAEFKPAKLGVVPIFETLRRAGANPHHLAVLTGGLVIVPVDAMPAIEHLLAEMDLPDDALRTSTMAACPGHLRIEATGGGSALLVRIVTALFQSGELRILVGTQSLLGQGWDAPALNSLVLASNTASFVLSNQMRGRAIRTNPEDAGKVANIWHLATLDPAGWDIASLAVNAAEWGALGDNASGDATHAVAAARIAHEELGFEVCGLGCYNREFAREVRAAARLYGVEPLITDDHLEVEEAIAAAQPELVLGTQMERHIAKRLGLPCAVISSPVHVQDFPARFSPQMGFEGANVIFDTWVHPLVMGLEEHLLTMFREDFEFSDEAGASHLHAHGPSKTPVETTLPEVVKTGSLWTDEAERELKKIPFFVRGKARRNTELFAADEGRERIDVETLYDAKAHYAR